MSARWLAIVNPTAGLGRAARAWPRVATALDAMGLACDSVETRAPGEATELAARAVEHGTRQVIAVGGDGTVHEVLNGLMRSGGRTTLAVAPLGTGNDFAHGLGVPRKPRAFAAMLKRGRLLAHDVGLLEYCTGHGRGRCHFLNVAGVGYDAYVLERVSRRGPRALAYLAALATGLASYQAAQFTVRAGHEVLEGRLFVALAMLGRSCGGGMRFAPRALPADGLLDLVTIDHLGIVAALTRIPSIYSGRILSDPAVRFRQCAEVTIEAEPAARVEADGQLLGHTPVTARVLPGAIDVVVP